MDEEIARKSPLDERGEATADEAVKTPYLPMACAGLSQSG
jgi:hypothetical protein